MCAPTREEEKYRAITAQAWSAMLLVLLTGLISDLWELFLSASSFEEMAGAIRGGAGVRFLWFLALLACVNAAVQVGVRTFDSWPFRRLVLFVSEAYLILLVLFNFVDLIVLAGAREAPGSHMILSLTHVVLCIWACWASGMWVKLAQCESSPVSKELGDSHGDAGFTE